MAPRLRNLPYEDRLSRLKLPTLEKRREKADLITVYRASKRREKADFITVYRASKGLEKMYRNYLFVC